MHDGTPARAASPGTTRSGRTPAAARPAGGVISGSLWRLPAMRLLAAYTFFGFTGFFATMSALPAWIAQRGTADSLAGFVTTTLLVATVSTQTLVPRLTNRLGMTTTLALGVIALGAPSLLLLVDGGYLWVLAICAARGIGFGILTVLGSMLTARIVPPARRGEAVGIYGLAIALPNLLAVAGGVALVSAGHFAIVAVLGAAPLLGLVTVRALARASDPETGRPGGYDGANDTRRAGAEGRTSAAGSADRRGAPAGAAAGRDDARIAARRSRRTARNAALGSALVLMVVTLTSGGFMTYLPIARPDGALATLALLVWGATGALARWRVGLLADRSGLRMLLPTTSALSVIGIAVVATGLVLGGSASWVVILLGSAVLGIGFGSTQNLTLVAAFIRARQRETATVSSAWNVGFDTGTAIGSGLVGVLITVVSIPSALALTSLLIVASLPLAVRNGRPPAPLT